MREPGRHPESTVGEPPGDPNAARGSLFAFRFILGCGCAVFALISVRAVALDGTLPWADVANTAILLGALVGVSCRPRWRPILSWLVFLAFVANALDGLYPSGPQTISSTHLLLPLLVLYGALLGDPWLSGAGMAFVSGEYLVTLARHWPLARPDFMGLTNLLILSLAAGVTCLAVWWAQRLLVRALRGKTKALETELDENRRLQRVILHDIANPLGAARNLAELARSRERADLSDIEKIDRMNGRIEEIVDSVRFPVGPDAPTWGLSEVALGDLIAGLRDVFAARLQSKGQRLDLTGGGDLTLRTRPAILANSVLANVLANALKFSSRGSGIEVEAWRQDGWVLIEVRDRGPGFSGEALRAVEARRVCSPAPGSESEHGNGHGLWIASWHLERLGGSLEVGNQPGGGAAVLLRLPEVGP